MWYGFRREVTGVAAANSHWGFAMTGHFTEIIILSVLASVVLFGVLELLWEIWEGIKPASSAPTPSARKGPWY
jgi:hypothetical protein